MKQYTYEVGIKLNDTTPSIIYDGEGNEYGQVERVYSNGLKKVADIYFDYRYFVNYKATQYKTNATFEAKKIFRRGKVWFEAKGTSFQQKFIINYENWRVGVPELFVTGNDIKIQIDKEMEDWSQFNVNEQSIARWRAVFNEQTERFSVELQIDEASPIQDATFFVAIAQATLFIGV